MTQILIYQDYVHNSGAVYKAFSTLFEQSIVAYADAQDIRNGILTPDTLAFIMPGGATRYVDDKLKGLGNANIKHYVANGGRYIGICAGAYYACQRTEWQPDFDQCFIIDNELDFFPGIAKGPIPQFISSANPHHMAAITTLQLEDNSEIKTFYWAGPLFNSTSEESKVLARYNDLPQKPAAIITGNHGKGTYLLCSPHIEIDSHQLELMIFDVADNRYADIAALESTDNISRNFFNHIIKKFLA